MFPTWLKRDHGRPIPLQRGVEKAARMGIEDVNDDTSLLPNVELDLLVKDTQCLTATAVKVGKGPHLFKSDWHDATDRPKDTVKARYKVA